MIGTIKRIKKRKVENMKAMQMRECKGEKNGRAEGKLKLKKKTRSKRKTRLVL